MASLHNQPTPRETGSGHARWIWIGAVVIIGSGLYIGYRERVRYRAAAKS